MKLVNFLTLFTTMIVAMTISTMAMPFSLDKRDAASITGSFATISKLISQLDQAQKAAGQSGTPDFSKASGLLAQLSQTAESADSALVALGSSKLDAGSASSIKSSLESAASSVRSITTLIQKGKEWFAKNNATQKVIQIIQANIDQFHQLFIDLNSHVTDTYHQAYKAPETRIICAMVDAIATLDKSQVSESAVDYCNGGGDGGQPDDASGLDAFNDGVTPSGYSSCGNSPTMFFQQAYTSKTLGTSGTQCTAGETVTPNSFEIPQNALML
ncbi:uncharacterized protein FA14DRAFT_182571 [Meira miltonrushii]|uniref:Uncharacterized protein n=1 Tax=Meira miltonrushii TaxID=1280837 RepID=A0A316V2J9_9BASI|nr:uncharacterized protein FA14DRAFT_182571 [Meira miltonrushii]PWN31779.1 hypothetical protein FA14DRAFT_182571 [Meira miltonrushii]